MAEIPTDTSDNMQITNAPVAVFCHGKGTFIPKKLKIMVGMVMIMVMEVSTFITEFRLLDMTELYASMVTSKMLLYTFAISIACLFSTMASSSNSSSSGNFLHFPNASIAPIRVRWRAESCSDIPVTCLN